MRDPQEDNVVARQRQMETIFVDHDRHRLASAAIEQFHTPVKGGLPSRGKLAALIGDSRIGKTFAANRYASKFPSEIGQNGVKRKVVVIDSPIEGGPRGLIDSAASAFGLALSHRMPNPHAVEAVLKEMKRSSVELVILDEANIIFYDKNKRVLNFARNFIRKMLNLQAFNVVCIGLEETYSMLAEDAQLIGRGGLEHCRLRPYNWEDESDRKGFRILCQKFDEEMPFESAGFASMDFSYRLFMACKGNIGWLKFLMEAAGALAINECSPVVDLGHFAQAWDARKRPGEQFNPFSR